MQNSMVMFTFSVFDWKYLFGKFGPKNQNCPSELKFRTRLIWICRIMLKICGVHFSVLDQINPFWVNLVKTIKIVSISSNLVPRLIWICGIQWCSLFQFLTGNNFLGKIGPKNQHCQFELKLRTILIWLCRITVELM